MRRELWRSPSCWPVGRHFSPGLTRDQVTPLISLWLLKRYTGKNVGKHVLLIKILCKCCCRFPDQSDNRFFWNRMLYLPYVRAGVTTSDWLIKVEYCYHASNHIEASQISITLTGDVWECGDSHCICWCQTGNNRCHVLLQQSIGIKFKVLCTRVKVLFNNMHTNFRPKQQ